MALRSLSRDTACRVRRATTAIILIYSNLSVQARHAYPYLVGDKPRVITTVDDNLADSKTALPETLSSGCGVADSAKKTYICSLKPDSLVVQRIEQGFPKP